MNVLERAWGQRRSRLQALLASAEVDGLVVTDKAVHTWLGFPSAQDFVLVTPVLVEAVCNEQNLLTRLGDESELCVLGFDSFLTAAHMFRWQYALPSKHWKPTGDWLEYERALKDEVEIALLQKAARLTSSVFQRLEAVIAPGRSELEIFTAAYEAMFEVGGDGFSFDPSIAGGKRSVLAWAGVSGYRLLSGEPLLVDLGVSYRGYRCDMSRSSIVGGSERVIDGTWRAAQAAVEEAFAVVLQRIRPGVTCGELSDLCEGVLARAGFGKMMPHMLGHGIGQRLHEPPYLAPGSQDVLAAGMVIAVEPGIALNNIAGFRREDVLLVTIDGCRALTQIQTATPQEKVGER
jgi:Xaa-Pro aminopeptidase